MVRVTGGAPAPCGVLIVDKPSGPTSHDVVAEARRRYRTRQVGHAGTLDPMASGVLLLLLGEATKLSSHLSANDKSYRTRIRFGRATDSLDAQGRTTAEVTLAPEWLDATRLRAALERERERRLQHPPAVSAIHVAGQRAHERVRRGEAVALEPRSVSVRDLTLIATGDEHVDVELTVSKGYYVRAFARDLGDALGVPAHVVELRRLSSGVFSLADATAWPPAAEPPAPIALAEAARRALPTATLTDEGTTRARTGKRLTAEHFVSAPEDDAVWAWLDPAGALVALGARADETFRVVRGFTAH